MSEYLRELEEMRPGDPHPPINTGPFDNPLVWNFLDPYGAERAHQRRPLPISRSQFELQTIMAQWRDNCGHRLIPFHRCIRNARPTHWGYIHCHELEHAMMLCRQKERYRASLLKMRFLETAKDYTEEDKRFFPNCMGGNFFTHHFNSHFWAVAAEMRLSGRDDNDPSNPVWFNLPNRALMRTEYSPTSWERSSLTHAMFEKELPSGVVAQELPSFPLPADKLPQAA